MMLVRSTVFVMLMALIAPPAAAAPAAVTLTGAVESSLARHPSVAVAREVFNAAQARLAEVRAGRNVQVTLTAGGSYGTACSLLPCGAPAWSPTGTVTASLDLIHQQAQYQIRQAEATLEAAAAGLITARQNAALAAGEAYYAALEAQAVVAVREAAVAAAEAQVRRAEAQVRAGVAARADVLQAQAALASAQVELISARHQVETSLAELGAAMGLPLTESVAVAASEGPAAPAVTRAEAIGMGTNRSDVQQARANAAAAEAGLALAELLAGPLLSVAATSTWDTVDNPSEVTWSLSSTITFALFDGGGARAAVARARADLAAARARETLVLQTAQLEAVQAWVALANAQARLEAAKVSEAAAAEALRATEGRYQAGIGTIVEVLTARAAFLSANLVRVQAEFDVRTAVLALRHAVGRPVSGGL